jgi:hypothetical protein
MEPSLVFLSFVTLGALLGFTYFAALGLNVCFYLGHGAGWVAPLVHTMRLLAIAAAFTLCARQGALALLSSVIGFHVIRAVAINRQIQRLEEKS